MTDFCPNCLKPGKPGEKNDTAVRLVIKSMSTDTPIDSIWGKARGLLITRSKEVSRGRSKFKVCSRCNRRWKDGAEQIVRKP